MKAKRATTLLLLTTLACAGGARASNLRRPRHVSVSWNHLAQIKPSCGLPASPAYMHYVKTHGRYLGFIVYPGSTVDSATREATITLMDSLHVNP